MMRMTIAGLAMAATLVFGTATPPIPGRQEERQEELSVEEAIVQAQNVTQAAYAECGTSTSKACQMLDYLLRDKMAQFDHLTLSDGKRQEGVKKMDLGDLKMIFNKNPKCEPWGITNYLIIIKLFDLDDDKMLDYREWLALDMLLTMTELIAKADKATGCLEFQLNGWRNGD